jgi:MOSC domain-containing protein YiiM
VSPPLVLSVARSASHSFSKACEPSIELVAGLGVLGDAHFGATVQHRSRVAKDPSQPNLRQVHLLHSELFAELARQGFSVGPGQLGENITTGGVDLLAVPEGATLRIGDAVVLRVTGLRNPCGQIDAFQPGLLSEVVERAPSGALVRKAGVMSVVVVGGHVRPADPIVVDLPARPHRPLERV